MTFDLVMLPLRLMNSVIKYVQTTQARATAMCLEKGLFWKKCHFFQRSQPVASTCRPEYREAAISKWLAMKFRTDLPTHLGRPDRRLVLSDLHAS